MSDSPVGLLGNFPANAGAARDAAILAAVHAGDTTYTWASIVMDHGQHTGTFQVFADGLKLGGVRLAGSARLCQQVADVLGACLPTPRILDEAWLQAYLKIPPQTIWPNTIDTATMVKHSAMIDVACAGVPDGSLVMPIGKPWCLCKDATPQKSALYGWQSVAPVPGVRDGKNVPDIRVKSPATPGVFVIQGFSTAHNPDYVDYSSSIWLVSRSCVVDGVTRDLVDILRDPELAPLVSHEGVLVNVRQPGVAQ